MTIEILTVLSVILVIIAIAEIFIFQKNRKLKNELIKREGDAKQKMYEISILSELSDKIGYSLGIQNVIEIITESLRDIVAYNVVSYMLLLPEKIIFRCYIEKSVSRYFVDDIKVKMTDFVSTILKTDFKNVAIEETLWGPAPSGESDERVGSFFNVPLVISGKVVGLMNVADTRHNIYKENQISIVNGVVLQATKALTKLQEAIESENSKLNSMVSSMADGVIMTDTDYNITVVNPAVKKALGFEGRDDLSVLDFAGGLKDKFDLKDKIEEAIRLEKVFISDEIPLESGFFKIVVSPVKDKWKTLGGVVVFRDITHEKEVERIKEDFTSMIVHELRSPLDSIKKMIELMRSSGAKKTQQAEYFQMIHSSSSEMLELVNNLLDMAKIEAGKFTLTKQPSDIKEIIKSRILFFDIAAKDAKVKIISNFGESIPDKVEFDSHTISQALNNLISNAIKFNKENGSIVVQVILHKNGESLEKEATSAGMNWFIKDVTMNIPDSLVVAVSNSGKGIAKEQIGKLFNKFFQVKSVFAEKGGTGLGLAITKSIVESHGGVVGADSIEGEGATFYFTLPIN